MRTVKYEVNFSLDRIKGLTKVGPKIEFPAESRFQASLKKVAEVLVRFSPMIEKSFRLKKMLILSI
jgi:hypothetical protein